MCTCVVFRTALRTLGGSCDRIIRLRMFLWYVNEKLSMYKFRRMMGINLCLLLPPLLPRSPGVCFVFPARSSRSSSCHSWRPRGAERKKSSPLLPLASYCPTFPLSKSAFPRCSSMKSTSGRLALRCPRPQAPSGEQTHSDMNASRCVSSWMQTHHVTYTLHQCRSRFGGKSLSFIVEVWCLKMQYTVCFDRGAGCDFHLKMLLNLKS